MRGKDGKGPRKGPTWTPDELLDHSGVPAQHRYQAMYMLMSAEMVALLEVAVALNGGEPLRVPVARIKQILADDPRHPTPDFVSGFTHPDGDDMLFGVERNPAEIAAKLDQDERRQALYRMGPSRN